MNKIIIFAFSLLLFTSGFASEDYHKTQTKYNNVSWRTNCNYNWRSHSNFSYNIDDTNIDIDDGTIIITHRNRNYATVEITEDYELYFNGKYIETNDKQKELIADYYDQVIEIIESAMDIGVEGARIGVGGVKIGLKAVRGVFRMILPGYDGDDLERELERETDKLEIQAERLEKEAEIIEDMAEELDEMYEKLLLEIPELNDLL